MTIKFIQRTNEWT